MEIPVADLVATRELISPAILHVHLDIQEASPADGFIGGVDISRVLVDDRREVDFSRMPGAFRRKVLRFLREIVSGRI